MNELTLEFLRSIDGQIFMAKQIKTWWNREKIADKKRYIAYLESVKKYRGNGIEDTMN